MGRQATPLRGSVLLPDTEYQIALPSNTVALDLTSPSNFPIRASLIAGDVLADEEGWVIDANNPYRVVLDRIPGPLYFASAEPGPILEIVAYSVV